MRGSSLQQLAIHEAAHAVVGVVLGGRVTRIRATRYCGGHCEFDPPPASNVDQAMLRLAGACGEGLAFGRVEGGSEEDRAEALDYAFRDCGDLAAADQLVADLSSQVRDLLADRWASVEAIASALIRGSGDLSGDELDEVVADALTVTFAELLAR